MVLAWFSQPLRAEDTLSSLIFLLPSWEADREANPAEMTDQQEAEELEKEEEALAEESIGWPLGSAAY